METTEKMEEVVGLMKDRVAGTRVLDVGGPATPVRVQCRWCQNYEDLCD